jgi:hypothetical protein
VTIGELNERAVAVMKLMMRLGMKPGMGAETKWEPRNLSLVGAMMDWRAAKP